MDTGIAAWPNGDPTELAQQFFNATQKKGASLGRRIYLSFIGTLACAAIHDVLPVHGSVDDTVRDKIRNIMVVAREIERVARATLDPGLFDDGVEDEGPGGEDEDADGGDDEAEEPEKEQNHYGDEDESMEDADWEDDGSEKEEEEEEEGGKEHSDDDMEEPPAKRSNCAASPTTKTPKRYFIDSILDEAVQGLLAPAAAAAGQAGSSDGEATAAAAGATAGGGDSSGGSAAATNGLPFPPAIVDAVIGSLDARSAAVAAAACRSLRDVHHSLTTFSLPAPLLTYLRTLAAAAHDQYADGSTESDFNARVPLDGSPVAGSDLILAAQARASLEAANSKGFVKMLRMLAEGTGREHMVKAVARAAKRGEAPPGSDKPGAKVALDAVKRPPPHPRSSPLAAFKHSKAVPMRTPQSTTSLSTTTTATASAFSSLDASCVLASARCDVWHLHCMPSNAWHVHVDGDLLSISHANGWKRRDPGLAAVPLRRLPRRRNQGRGVGPFRYRPGLDEESDEDEDGEGAAGPSAAAAAEEEEAQQRPDYYDDGDGMDRRTYDTGFFNHVERVCSDAANGLVWAAADEGGRIKAFRAPLPPTSPGRAGCNRGPRNGMSLQYTLFSDVPGLSGRHAGLHVLGDRLMCVKGSGALLLWDVRELPAQAEEVHARGDDEGDVGGDEAGGGERFKGYLGWRSCGTMVEVTRGVRPHDIYLLPRPRVGAAASATGAAGGSGPEAPSPQNKFVKRTCLLADGDAPTAPALAAVVNPYGLKEGGEMLLTWDLATQRVRQRMFGHLYDVTDMAAPPPAWRQPHLFASCAKSADVKIWDMRLRGGGAAVTLVTGGTEVMNACVLAMASGGGGGGVGDGAGGSGSASGGGGSQLGAGMLCFAGGAGESIWCWDLRGGAARPLYELSTGNSDVDSLAWHAASNSLYAACSSRYEDPVRKDRWFQTPVEDDDSGDDMRDWGNGGGSSSDGSDSEGEEVDGEEQEEEEGDGNAAGQVEAGGGGGEAGERRMRLWPRRAVHRPDVFRRFFRLTDSCTLRYRFSERPAGRVPASERPSFSSYY